MVRWWLYDVAPSAFINPRHAARAGMGLVLLAIFLVPVTSFAQADPKPKNRHMPGRFIPIRGSIDSNLKNRILNVLRAAVRQEEKVIIFDLKASASEFGPCLDLAQEINRLNVDKTVAFVNGPIKGHAVLVALACKEVVMSKEGRLGDVYHDQPAGGSKIEEEAYRTIAREGVRHEWLAMAMVKREFRLLRVTTPNGREFLPEERLEDLKGKRVLETKVIKERGSLMYLQAEEARDYGLVRLPAVDSRQELAALYDLPPAVAVSDVLVDPDTRPLLLKMEGYVNSSVFRYLRRRLNSIARKENILFVQIDSSNGDEVAIANIANELQRWPGKVVAWVPKQATGPATLLVFGCDELVIGPQAEWGGYEAPNATPDIYQRVADSAVAWSKDSTFHEAIVRGVVDPNVEVFSVRDKKTGKKTYLTDQQWTEDGADGQPKRFEKDPPGPIKAKRVWRLQAEEALRLDVASGQAGTLEELYHLYGVPEPESIQPIWIDRLVDVLTTPGGATFLVLAGFIALYLEFQLAGFGIAGIISAICFTLFFWSRFLADTANTLELLLFILGVVLLAIEIFVLPGFGITGISGLILMVISLVLASQQFSWPRTPSESREMMVNFGSMGAAFTMLILCIAMLTRYLPRMPLFSRLVLSPPEYAEAPALGANLAGSYESDIPEEYLQLLGQVGVALSPLRPAGRMRFGERTFDVLAQGEFIEDGVPIEVIEVHHNRIVVRATELPFDKV